MNRLLAASFRVTPFCIAILCNANMTSRRLETDELNNKVTSRAMTSEPTFFFVVFVIAGLVSTRGEVEVGEELMHDLSNFLLVVFVDA